MRFPPTVRPSPLSLVAPLLLVGLSSPAQAAAPPESAEWAQYRGAGGLGIAGSGDVPRHWDDTTILWKTAIEGRGHSSPVYWDGRLYVTTSVEGEVIPGAQAPEHTLGGEPFRHPDAVGADRRHTLKVVAIDAATGEVLWSRVAHDGRMYDDHHKAGSYAAPTPIVDGERVYAYFGSEGVHAFDLDGEPVWSRDIGDLPTIGMGVGTSPVLFGELLIIQADHGEGEGSFIVALDRRSGEEVWKTPRPVEVSWTTPLLVKDARGRDQLITNGNQFLISYDPATGKEIWRVKGLESNAIHTPLLAGDLVILTAGHPTKIAAAVPLDLEGDHSGEDAWRWSYGKGTAYVASNVLYDGLVYLLNDGGVLTCLDAATGEIVYEGGRFPERARFMASPIVVGDEILMISTRGEAAFVKTGREHEILAQTGVDEAVSVTPAVAGGRLYVRGEEHLYAIGRPQ